MAVSTSLPSSSSVTKLEPFLLLAKSAKGAAAAKLVHEATAAPGCYVFAELAECEGVRELYNDPSHTTAKNLLDLFQFGTLTTYLQSVDSLPQLTPNHINKLRQLTLVSLASRCRQLAYDELLDALKLNVYIASNGSLEQNGVGSGSGSANTGSSATTDPTVIRALEDVIIDAMYAGLVAGKLDQRKRKFYVDSVIGRDVGGDDEIAEIEKQLRDWNDTTASVLAHLSDRIKSTRHEADERTRQRAQHDQRLGQTLHSLSESRNDGPHDGKAGAAIAPGEGSWGDAMELDSPDEDAGASQRKSPSSKKKTKRTRT